MQQMERRVDSRLEVKLPVHTRSSKGNARLFVGVTENMSRSGMLVLWNSGERKAKLPQTGEWLTLEIELPANHSFGRKYIQCRAMVVRVSKTETSFPLVAFEITQMQFRSYADRRVAVTSPGGNTAQPVM